MAEKDLSLSGNAQPAAIPTVQTELPSPPVGLTAVLQDGMDFSLLDFHSNKPVQPFPTSPKLQRKLAKNVQPSKEQLSRRMEELEAESCRTKAHIHSLKKRKADLARATEMMKQKIQEHFDNMRDILKQDEQAVLDSLDLDLRQTSNSLDQLLKNWVQHQDHVTKSISITQRALNNEEDRKGHSEGLSLKKPDASERMIRLNEDRFEKLLKTLSSMSKSLNVQLQKKTLLLNSCPTVTDRQTCHSQIVVTSNGRGLYLTGSAHLGPEHPLQFDKVWCALGLPPVTVGQRYWEVDVHRCSAWAVGVAYGSLERKGRDKNAKLGRNRNSWCLEHRDKNLSAWHNNQHVACHRGGPVGKVGVWVDYEKGQLMFYDADTMNVLQRFSAAVAPVFDRVHHQFTEPLYLAIRFLKPPENQVWPNYLEFYQFTSA